MVSSKRASRVVQRWGMALSALALGQFSLAPALAEGPRLPDHPPFLGQPPGTRASRHGSGHHFRGSIMYAHASLVTHAPIVGRIANARRAPWPFFALLAATLGFVAVTNPVNSDPTAVGATVMLFGP